MNKNGHKEERKKMKKKKILSEPTLLLVPRFEGNQ